MDWQDSLKTFLDNNPDLPQGDDTVILPEAEPKRTAPRLDIILDKKGRNGKQATIVTGFTCSDNELLQLAARLKSRLGTGGSARGGEILIQGDRRQQLLALLTAEGYKARII